MATCGYSCSSWERNPRLWQKCLDEIAKQMVASGWVRKAGKFAEVQRRKAHKLFIKLLYPKKQSMTSNHKVEVLIESIRKHRYKAILFVLIIISIYGIIFINDFLNKLNEEVKQEHIKQKEKLQQFYEDGCWVYKTNCGSNKAPYVCERIAPHKTPFMIGDEYVIPYQSCSKTQVRV